VIVNTTSDNELPQRSNPASGVHLDLGRNNIILLTITTEQRIPWLASEIVHQILRETWSEANAWLVWDYLLMPDHLHCFRDLHFGIEAWIKYWKREFALKKKRLAGTLAPPERSRLGLQEWKFQSRGWHHRLRGGESYSEKWRYVQENPLRKGLCKSIADWPFKGKIFDLIWTGQ